MTPDIYLGDCIETMQMWLPDESVDSVVTDPPYELKFMGKKWDGSGIAFSVPMWAETLRTLKPGGVMLAFGGTRTYHRMVCAIEDAGFEIRDQIGWVYGSGFAKSHNGEWGGTALKPAWEPIVVARKPLIGTVEANWRLYGTGALNIDGCRVDGENPSTTLGRWPANLIHDGSDEVLAAFPNAPGQMANASSSSSSRNTQNVYGAMTRGNGRGDEPSGDSANDGVVGFKMKPGARRGDAGSAARFFYCAKASKADRNAGLPDGVVNTHPTVKPTALCGYLQRLVTPAGGTTLDMFMGSGSFGYSAKREGFNYIGIDSDPESVAVATLRAA